MAVGTQCSGCCHCGVVAIYREVKIRVNDGLSTGTKKVAVVERWPLVGVRLYVVVMCTGGLFIPFI